MIICNEKKSSREKNNHQKEQDIGITVPQVLVLEKKEWEVICTRKGRRIKFY